MIEKEREKKEGKDEDRKSRWKEMMEKSQIKQGEAEKETEEKRREKEEKDKKKKDLEPRKRVLSVKDMIRLQREMPVEVTNKMSSSQNNICKLSVNTELETPAYDQQIRFSKGNVNSDNFKKQFSSTEVMSHQYK